MEKKMMTSAALVIMVVILNACPAMGGCDEALVELLPCATFVMGPAEGTPPPACCEGMQHVVGGADTAEKRRSLCQCLKDTAVKNEVKIKPENIKHAVDACGVKILVPIDPNIDCSKIPAF